MSDIDLVVWAVYFTVGFFLLILLILGRRSLKIRAAEREEADRAVMRLKDSQCKSFPDIEFGTRGIR